MVRTSMYDAHMRSSALGLTKSQANRRRRKLASFRRGLITGQCQCVPPGFFCDEAERVEDTVTPTPLPDRVDFKLDASELIRSLQTLVDRIEASVPSDLFALPAVVLDSIDGYLGLQPGHTERTDHAVTHVYTRASRRLRAVCRAGAIKSSSAMVPSNYQTSNFRLPLSQRAQKMSIEEFRSVASQIRSRIPPMIDSWRVGRAVGPSPCETSIVVWTSSACSQAEQPEDQEALEEMKENAKSELFGIFYPLHERGELQSIIKRPDWLSRVSFHSAPSLKKLLKILDDQFAEFANSAVDEVVETITNLPVEVVNKM